MSPASKTVSIYLEVGSKRVFAGAIDWPGWCRAGRDEASALQSLLDHAPRYARALRGTGIAFKPPAGLRALKIVERLKGNATTDFGAPGVPPNADAAALSNAELARCLALLKTFWRSLDAAARKAQGRALRKGPRGGGREVSAILRHVHEAEAGYLSAFGWKPPREATDDVGAMRLSVLDGLAASARGEIASIGPRGGRRWSARYFVRRAAWHILDHAWEIEDRIE